MKQFTVSFFGHRYIDDIFRLETHLEELTRELIKNKEYVEFLVGRNGDFDQLVASVIRNVRRNYRDDNSVLVLVLPYATSEFSRNQESFEKYYGEIEVCALKVHPKAAISARNRQMVDRSDLIVCYVEQKVSGAYNAIKYAQKLNKRIINLADEL